MLLNFNLFKRLLLLLFVFLCGVDSVYAQSIDDLKLKIADKNSEIKLLEAEIIRLDKEVKNTQSVRQTLSTELRQIDAIKKKLDADIKLTSRKIDIASLNILNAEKNISDKNQRIMSSEDGVAESLRIIYESELDSLAETVLSGINLSKIWSQISELETLQNETMSHIADLKVLKLELQENKTRLENEKKKEVKLRSQLADQQNIAKQNIQIKNKLIADTKNKESNYKKLLDETEAKMAAVENELLQYESELKVIIDPTKLPTSGTKVLSWPLNQVHITQYFGLTEFSKTQPIYNGKGHNGLDFRAGVGTVLKAAADGTVIGTGDTDPVCYGASYGKWIMIDHANGIATIYGHLSLIKATTGQKVSRGDLIGYTGKSGYATGPHLHFTVAASQAVKIGNLKSKVKGCGTYTIPLGPFNGYLNPLLYL